jgi:hypothetical protein
MNALDEWTTAACEALGLDVDASAQQALVLEVAREVARGVLRPAAPVAAYLLGLAVGRGADPARAAAAIQALAGSWPSGPAQSRPAPPGAAPSAG